MVYEIGELFTSEEIRKALKLYNECPQGTFNKRAVAEIVGPVMDRINEITGQENHASYVAYALEWALLQTEQKYRR